MGLAGGEGGAEWPLLGQEALGLTLLFVFCFLSAATKMEELTEKYKVFNDSLKDME